MGISKLAVKATQLWQKIKLLLFLVNADINIFNTIFGNIIHFLNLKIIPINFKVKKQMNHPMSNTTTVYYTGSRTHVRADRLFRVWVAQLSQLSLYLGYAFFKWWKAHNESINYKALVRKKDVVLKSWSSGPCLISSPENFIFLAPQECYTCLDWVSALLLT